EREHSTAHRSGCLRGGHSAHGRRRPLRARRPL
ncbi:MAG: hypothetical protein AVDCRST_MAG78-1991, partial [uncultured Rubrobacteraceae bacterium]